MQQDRDPQSDQPVPDGRARDGGPLSFIRDEGAAVSVEFVIWVPFIVLVLSLVADVSLVFHRQTAVLHEIHLANRAVATGRSGCDGPSACAAAAKSSIETALARIAPTATVTSTLSGGVLDSSVVVPVTDLMAIGMVAAFDGLDLTVRAQHLAEY